jgi:hypothetical protein
MQKFKLVDDEDSCCGLMHIVDNEQDYICRGYDDTFKMTGIVDKLNMHDELVEVLRGLMHANGALAQWAAADAASVILAKIDSASL